MIISDVHPSEPPGAAPFAIPLVVRRSEQVTSLLLEAMFAGRTVDRRAVVNALVYLARGGCPGRLLPREFPPWTVVRYYFDTRTQGDTWAEVNRRLVEQAREQRGRAAQPTAAIIDSQRSKATKAGGERGFDGGKNVRGRERHYLVDVEGHRLAVLVEATNVADREGARWLVRAIDR